MKIPNKRTDFERHLQLLREGILQKTFIIGHKIPGYMRSLNEVHALPNRRLNMLSVNETARLTANNVAGRPAMLKKMEG
ncbi:MAG: hypothetical protein V4456_16620 [Bacteroidota bacterium]